MKVLKFQKDFHFIRHLYPFLSHVLNYIRFQKTYALIRITINTFEIIKEKQKSC